MLSYQTAPTLAYISTRLNDRVLGNLDYEVDCYRKPPMYAISCYYKQK